MARGFGTFPSFAQDDGAGLSPMMRAFLAGIGTGQDDAPPAVAPGFTSYAAPPTPTGAPTPIVNPDAPSLAAVLRGMGSGATSAGHEMIGAVQDAGALTRDFLSGEVDTRTPGSVERGFGAAGLAMTGSLPFSAPAGAVRMFGGRNAATADHAGLARAEQMAGSGAERGAIWDQTGWFKGADDKWRFEIPDDKAALTRSAAGDFDTPYGMTVGRAQSVFQHEPAYRAYPQMRGLDVSLSNDPGIRADLAGGGYGGGAITGRAGSLDAARSLTLHEMQHAAQQAEGFARGGSPAQFTREAWAQDQLAPLAADRDAIAAQYPGAREAVSTRDTLQSLLADRYGPDWRETAIPRHLEGMDLAHANVSVTPGASMLSKADTAYAKKAAFVGDDDMAGFSVPIWRDDQYHRLAGEVEARNVQARRDLTPEQRRATPPWQTQDVPDARQIVQFRGDPGSTSYSGGPAGALAGLPAIAASSITSPAAAPSDPKGAPMSSGLAPFGQLPALAGFSADDLAQLVQRMQAQGQGQPQAGAPGFGALSMPPVDPQTTGGIGARSPAIAMDEAQTRNLEQGLGMVPPGYGDPVSRAPRSSALDRIFDGTPLGAPQSFAGTSGGTLPDAYAPRDVPLPPGRPSAQDLMAPEPTAAVPQRQIVASSIYRRGPAGTDPGDSNGIPPGGRPPAEMPSGGSQQSLAPGGSARPGAVAPAPVDSFDPLSGQPTSGSPKPIDPRQAMTVGAQAVQAQPGVFERFVQGLGRPEISDLLMNIGIGLMSTRGFGAGVAAGLKGYQESQQKQATNDILRARFGMEATKFQQAQKGQNDTIGLLVRAGHSPEAAGSMVSAAAAGNNVALNHALSNLVPQVPANYRLAADGKSYEPIPGSEADPAVKERNAKAVATDKEQTPLTDIEERRKRGIPDNDTRAAWADPNGKVTFNDGPPPLAPRPGQTLYERGTLKPILTAPSAKPDNFDTETKLRTEFSKQLGSFADVHDGYGRVIAATKQRQDNPGSVSPAADIGLIFGYMKMLDPGSVVREGEYATAKNAAGVPDRVVNAYNKALSGEFLNDRQRQDFIGQADSLYGTARKTAEGVATRYRGLASQYNVDPDRSVYLPEMPVPPRLGGATQQGQGQGQSGTSPQPGGPALRFQQLRRGGMSAADAHAQMAREGF